MQMTKITLNEFEMKEEMKKLYENFETHRLIKNDMEMASSLFPVPDHLHSQSGVRCSNHQEETNSMR